MLQQDKASDYLICSGKSISFRQVVEYLFAKLDISVDHLRIDKSLFKPTETQDVYGDNELVKFKIKWEYNLTFESVLDILIEVEINYRKIFKNWKKKF